MSYQKMVGKWGEDLAEKFLCDNGYRIIGRNVYTPYGEIDVIAEDPEDTIFVEVKTRTSKTFGNPEDSINKKKQKHLIESALYYMQQHKEDTASWRIDVIAIEKSSKGISIPRIEWFKNAVS